MATRKFEQRPEQLLASFFSTINTEIKALGNNIDLRKCELEKSHDCWGITVDVSKSETNDCEFKFFQQKIDETLEMFQERIQSFFDEKNGIYVENLKMFFAEEKLNILFILNKAVKNDSYMILLTLVATEGKLRNSVNADWRKLFRNSHKASGCIWKESMAEIEGIKHLAFLFTD